MKEKIKKNWKFFSCILGILTLMILYFLFVYDIGINSAYFIKRDFQNAFLARKTGNCDLFKEYIYTDKDKWGERCIKEKDGDDAPIKEFIIKDITIKKDHAFLQVHLKRDIRHPAMLKLNPQQMEFIERGYVVNYDLIKDNSTKFLFLPKTRWLIKNEAR